MTITLSVLSMLIFSQTVLNFSLRSLEDKVDVTVFFTLNAQESEILSLKESIENYQKLRSGVHLCRSGFARF